MAQQNQHGPQTGLKSSEKKCIFILNLKQPSVGENLMWNGRLMGSNRKSSVAFCIRA